MERSFGMKETQMCARPAWRPEKFNLKTCFLVTLIRKIAPWRRIGGRLTVNPSRQGED
ncbi:hypothetical protein [Rhodoferax sp.]|uniref:hypothetical protein n=1 Tax=Rhodoferax sp. TaxID=50421 RepID=UPI0025E75E27|nr:hypothetical protein [Rhodoferax sp.]